MKKIPRGGKNARSSPRQCIRATKSPYLQKVDSKWDKPCDLFRSPLRANILARNEDYKMYLKSNTRQENFRTFEERDILNGIKSD